MEIRRDRREGETVRVSLGHGTSHAPADRSRRSRSNGSIPKMSSGIIEVVLSREGAHTPWGFRLHGGSDIGYPLVIQRVFVGSAADSDLQRGDHLLHIQGRDTTGMTHREAHDLIKAAGTRLQMLIRRMPGAPPFTPTTPMTPDGMHPFARMLSEGTRMPSQPAPMFQPMSPPRMTSQRSTPQPPKDYCFSPLPTTPTFEHAPLGGLFPPMVRTPKNQADIELIENIQERHKERNAITNQGYRTLPLIAPKPKTRHDIPMGSYLRHAPDPNWKGRSAIQPSTPKFFNSMPTPTYSAIGHYRGTRKPPGPPPGAPNFERPIDDSSQLVHHQYNSPMFLYSQGNIDDTIREQTGLAPPNTKLHLTKPVSPVPPGPPSPGTLGGTLAAGTKLTNIVDITLSPTFQLLQETEKRTASPQPPENRTPTLPRRAPGFAPRPFEGEEINAFGSPKEVIHQSGSFKTLMTSLYSAPPPTDHE